MVMSLGKASSPMSMTGQPNLETSGALGEYGDDRSVGTPEAMTKGACDMRLEEYTALDGVGLAALVASRQVKPSELMELALSAAAATDEDLHALVEVYDDAMDRAKALDADPVGSLGGVPMVRKDIGAAEAGKLTELGSRLTSGLRTHRDSYLTTGFKDAGLVIMGRSATSEMGCYATIESMAHGVTNNPWKQGVTSGASSGGSAALVAAGVVPIGHANDGAGSIRIPASCCGLVGLKPSRGRVSAGPSAAEPNFGGSVQLVVTRTMADTAAVLDAVSGPRPGDPFVIPGPTGTFTEATMATAPRSGSQLRIGFTTASWGPASVDPQVASATRRAAAVLSGLGHDVEEVEFPLDWERFEPAFIDLWAVGAAGPILDLAARMGRPANGEFLEPVTLSWLEHCLRLSAIDVTHALDAVNRLARGAGRFFDRFDVLITPTLAQLPAPFGVLGGTRTDLDAVGNARVLLEFNPYCPLFNLTGHPALSLPLAESVEGLPIGVQLVGRNAAEDTLLFLGAQLERAVPWSQRRPPVHAATGQG
jgi:amidase